MPNSISGIMTPDGLIRLQRGHTRSGKAVSGVVRYDQAISAVAGDMIRPDQGCVRREAGIESNIHRTMYFQYPEAAPCGFLITAYQPRESCLEKR
jgi:hypothetical protein